MQIMRKTNKIWILGLVMLLAASCGGRKDKAEAEARDEIAQTESEMTDSEEGAKDSAPGTA